MSRDTLYIAITNHGFGHTVRAASVANLLQKLCPDILLIIVTMAPRWLLESYIEGEFIHRQRAFDVGVIQQDSIQMDKVATREKLNGIKKNQRQIIAQEVNFIKTNKVGLILADIPPLAASIAQAAGIPCWMMSNFGWDFIYRDWGEEFAEIVAWIEECYKQCDRLFRLPLYESMSAFSHITDVGLTGGNPKFTTEKLQTNFNFSKDKEHTILLTFGGLGLQAIPYHNLLQFPHHQFISFDAQAPDLPNLIKINDYQYRPVDFMPLCGRVISKPGYSTFAEALRLDIPIVSLLREGFAESPLLIEGITNYSYHQILSPTEFFDSNWEFLSQPMQPPKLGMGIIAKDGNESISSAVIEYLHNC